MAANYPTDYLAYDKKAQNQFNTFTGLQCSVGKQVTIYIKFTKI